MPLRAHGRPSRARLSLALSTALSPALLLACAAQTPPPATAVAVTAPPPAPPPADVTAVPAPDNLIVVGRFSRPVASSKIATDWAHLPELDGSDFVDGLLEGFTESKPKAKLGVVVDPAAPIDYAVTLEPRIGAEPAYAMALGVRSLDAAKAALGVAYDLTPGDNGILRIEARRATPAEAPKGEEDAAKPCELAPSAGASAYRLVCGSSHEALTALGPYLTRTAPRQTIASDAHVEFRAQPLKGLATLGRLQGPAILNAVLGLNSATEPATTDLVASVVGDLLDYTNDLDAMTLDATLDPAEGTIAFRTTFKSATSFVARMMTAHPERVDVPPAVFSRLPGDTDLAFFGSGLDPADLQHPRDVLVAVAREQLKKTKLPDPDQHALVELVGESIHGGRALVAHGMADATSYWLCESEESGAHTEKMAKDALAAFARPAVAKWIKDTLPSKIPLPTWKLAGPIAGLPKGSVHVELTIPEPAPSKPRPNGKKLAVAPVPKKPTSAASSPSAPRVVHLVFVPDGPRSWFAMSTSEAVIRVKVASVLGAAPAEGTLSPSLAPFKEMRMTSGGFFTIRSLIEMAHDASEGHRAAKRVHWEEILGHLPANGTTPILVTAAPGAPTSEDPGGAYELDLMLPAEAVRDAVWLGVQLSLP